MVFVALSKAEHLRITVAVGALLKAVYSFVICFGVHYRSR